MGWTVFKSISLFFREFRISRELMSENNKKPRTLVFYSEKDVYYQYYKETIDYILANSELDICYISSDISDPVFANTNPRIKPFYLNFFLATFFPMLDSKVIVMTMPDIERYYLKRSGKAHHVYMFHAIVSTHLQYRFGAFDHYDSILCVGPHHRAEIEKSEMIYNLKPKRLVDCGYSMLETIYQKHRASSGSGGEPVSRRKKILIAPTWGESSILELCIMELGGVLGDTEYDVVIRPHPQYVRTRGKQLKEIAEKLAKYTNIRIESNLVAETNIHNADILITDRSGIAFEYAFGTERPVLFIDTPLKINNPRYLELDCIPIEISSRERLGKSITIKEIPGILPILSDFVADYPRYRQQILLFRGQYIYNWQGAAKACGEYIIGLCK